MFEGPATAVQRRFAERRPGFMAPDFHDQPPAEEAAEAAVSRLQVSALSTRLARGLRAEDRATWMASRKA